MIRLGVIGRGPWGKHYPKAAFEAGNCTVTDVAGRDWRALLDRMIDAFVVATPPESHEEICCELLARGRPVMVEKPLALSVAAAERIASAANAASVPFLVNHQHLFAPAYEELRARLATDGSGVYVLSMGSGRGPVRDYSALWDYGPHDVAMFLGVVGEPPVSVRMRHAIMNGTRSYWMSLASGTTRGDLYVSSDADKRRVFSVMPGGYVYDDLDREGKRLRHDGVAVDISPEKPLTRSVRAFADAVRTGKADWRFGSFGVEVVRILDAADRRIMEA